MYNRDIFLKNRISKYGSTFSSKLEKFFAEELSKLGIEFVQEYNLDNRYPFFCDFYLPGLDMFIEINGHWTHGNQEYDKDSLDDIKQVEIWKEKSKLNSVYKYAIEAWTINDKLRFDTARKNKLNFKILWNKHDIENFVSTLK